MIHRIGVALVLLFGLLCSFPAQAQATLIRDVRVLTGAHHARIIVRTEGTVGQLDTSAQPPVGAVPARGILLLRDARPDVTDSFTETISRHGILRLHVTLVGTDTQLTVDMTDSRNVTARAVGPNAIVFDLLLEGREGDPGLPGDDDILAWASGEFEEFTYESTVPERRYLVVVDAGHGGHDYGALGHSGTREADIALQIARRTVALLEAHPAIDTVMTREEDLFVSLEARSALANEMGADLFLSIHANATEREFADQLWGVETYSLDTASDQGAARVARRENRVARENGGSPGSVDRLRAQLQVAGTNRLSAQLAGAVQNGVIGQLTQTYGASQVNDLGAKTALFYVLTTTSMPAILFEAGFLSHPEDERRLRSPYYQQLLAEALVQSVEGWLVSQ